MAAGPGAASSGHSGGRGSSAALESSLDRRFQGVTNTMESIQGLSSWCIENKKHHSLIVRYWMKWLKKSDANHRLNLFYLANDVIQNCKRRNAIIYRTSFADVLPDAALLVKDAKVWRSVDRIFSIWQERNVYPEELISELKANLQKKEEKEKEKEKEKEREKAKQKEKAKEKAKEKEQPPPATVNPKTALKSKIVAEFVPHDFMERLVSFKRSLEESDLREKQLATLRLDVCSTEALKRLKDKAGGNKFSKDFEEGSTKLQEFVTFLEGQMKAGPPMLEALGNADIFYEMQYKEVKIVVNAYKAFANRVSSLKRKLDSLKATLPRLDDSSVPSPSEDVPSPTGSESPFHAISSRSAASTGEGGLKLQRDNRDIEDMDMSEEEDATANIATTDERKEKSSLPSVSKTSNAAAAKSSQISVSNLSQTLATPTKIVSGSATNEIPPANTTPIINTPGPALVFSPSPLQVNLANVDLGKISSILNSLSNAMKTTGVSPVSRPSPGTPTTPSSNASSSKAPPSTPGSIASSSSLASILSKVDICPGSILNVLTKTQTHTPKLQGLSSILSAARSGSLNTPDTVSSSSATSSSTDVAPAVTSSATTPTTPKTQKPTANNLKRESEQEKGREREKVKEMAKERDREREDQEKESKKEAGVSNVALPSLESKINSFLQGNPGFSALGFGLDDMGSNSPLLVGEDNLDSTPVRDESGSTPTQDEIMDTPQDVNDPHSAGSPTGPNLSPTAYHSELWDAVITPREVLGENERKDRDYRTPQASRLAVFSPNATKPVKAMTKTKEEIGLKRKVVGLNVPSASKSQNQTVKAKMEGPGGKSAASRKPVGEDGMKDNKRTASADNGEHYHRIETLVSSASNEGAPIETLDYGNRIQTVESIRVIGRGLRRGSTAGSRVGGAWYEDEEFMEAPRTTLPNSQGPDDSEELGLAPPVPAHLPPLLQYPPPPYANENPTRPSHAIPQHHPPPPFFPPPSLPHVPPPLPPMPQAPHPPRDFPLSPTSTVMVGGILVPIDRILPYPPANLRPDGVGLGLVNGGSASQRGSKPQLPSLLGEPPRPGTLKEQFTLLHAPPFHRPGTPGVPPPLLGRVREGPSPTPPSPSTPTTPNPSPLGEPRSLLSIPNRPPSNNPNQRARRPSSPQSLPHLPNQHQSLRPSQFTRGSQPLSPPSLNREHLLAGVKRPAASFSGGSFNPPKRPFLPPRY
ncbi:LOW QUALITY PROTEIN: regulation of nuclear pre-mRNA domain-containing protein 2-like [Xyrauchen texanus]|uniref:LOW QUALITY PROTEIN: regulation of nuclear pre-mRNA domain-containing protein 2-like n=1 Tax=Xyrauchen texanus TaxID=154827 RepID=UPI002242091C|nr:LOW QUALITY PROTEIN: regulation of nuclear pre-mRNA domain-containing protein 2-like [Xyrauchen texanus]